MKTGIARAAAVAAGARRGRKREQVSIAVILLCLVLAVLILPPTFFLIHISLHTVQPDGSAGEFTLDHYRRLVTGRFFLPSLINTVVYAVGAAVVAMALGVVQAVLVERTNTPGREYVFLGSIMALGIPNVLYVVAWLLILGRAGPVNGVVESWFGPTAAINVYSLWGMIFVEGVNFVPLTFLLMSSVLRSTDAAFEEAALMSGSRPLKTFRSITLKMSLPGVLALLLLVVTRAVESFEVPALVGMAGNINVLTTNVFQSSRSSAMPNYGEAGAYSVVLLIIIVGLLYLYNRLSRHAHRFQTITGKGYRPRVINLGPIRYVGSAVLLLIFMLVAGFPLIILTIVSLQPFYDGISADTFARLTLDNYRPLMEVGSLRDAILNTLLLGVTTATLVVPFTALCAWLVVRRRPGAWLLDQLATLPLIFPAIVMSVAFLYIFINIPLPLYGTLLSVVIASSVRYLPYGMRYAYAGALQIHNDLEDASMLSGARQASTFLRIVIPLLSTAMISAWFFVFLLAVQAVSLPLMLVGPGTEVVAVTLFELWQNGQVTELAAMGMAWVCLMTFISAGFYYVTRRFQWMA
jgi:iron(III) transport system permease protein